MAIQVAIIGCGGMANSHLNAYLTIHEKVPGKVVLVAMCDEVEERADAFAERVKAVTGKKPAVFTDTDAMLATNNRPPELDATAGLRAKSICEAIYESNASGQVVDYEATVAGDIEEYQKPINARWGL